MEKRVNRLEQTVTRHDDQIATLFSKVDDVNCRLDKIIQVMTRIQYGMYGAIIYYVLSEVGILEALQLVK
jgi:hypothetical protein